mmetsp:Transcript_46946/g.149904  ORF Transcript_46946/g.149904 Transcript_46946/m.149904 type:complete len:350 (+) Transcript_46946:390-1439(+)
MGLARKRQQATVARVTWATRPRSLLVGCWCVRTSTIAPQTFAGTRACASMASGTSHVSVPRGSLVACATCVKWTTSGQLVGLAVVSKALVQPGLMAMANAHACRVGGAHVVTANAQGVMWSAVGMVCVPMVQAVRALAPAWTAMQAPRAKSARAAGCGRLLGPATGATLQPGAIMARARQHPTAATTRRASATLAGRAAQQVGAPSATRWPSAAIGRSAAMLTALAGAAWQATQARPATAGPSAHRRRCLAARAPQRGPANAPARQAGKAKPARSQRPPSATTAGRQIRSPVPARASAGSQPPACAHPATRRCAATGAGPATVAPAPAVATPCWLAARASRPSTRQTSA